MAADKGLKASASLQARIKKMMQSDEDVGKVAKAAPVLIGARLGRSGGERPACVAGAGLPRLTAGLHFANKLCTRRALPPWCCCGAAKALDVFLQSMVDGAAQVAEGRGARMLTPSHM